MYKEQIKEKADDLGQGYQAFRGILSDSDFLVWAARNPEPCICPM